MDKCGVWVCLIELKNICIAEYRKKDACIGCVKVIYSKYVNTIHIIYMIYKHNETYKIISLSPRLTCGRDRL